jgi:hypothetical protein
MDLIRSIGNSENSGTCKGVTEEVIVAQAGTAEHLDCSVNDSLGHLGYCEFDHCNIFACTLGPKLINTQRCLQY